MTERNILINLAPALMLWATCVVERLEFDHDEGLSLGKAVAGLTAQSKGPRLLHACHHKSLSIPVAGNLSAVFAGR